MYEKASQNGGLWSIQNFKYILLQFKLVILCRDFSEVAKLELFSYFFEGRNKLLFL